MDDRALSRSVYSMVQPLELEQGARGSLRNAGPLLPVNPPRVYTRRLNHISRL
jgi:hypothetical protein